MYLVQKIDQRVNFLYDSANREDSYYSVVKVRVRASSRLYRKIAGWIHSINEYYWGVV